jgi:uncharacterized membrane protein YhhN
LSADTLFAAALPPALLSALAVAALVTSDFRGWRAGRYLCKPLAAAAFIWLALRLGATGNAYGLWLLGGLALCMVGDICLMFDDERSFLAGLVAFLCGHLLYAVAFLQLPSSPTGLALSAVPALALLVLVLRWLRPHVGADMKLPVTLYTVVITAMLLCAGLTFGQPGAALIIAGAWGFALSDIAVARRQFVDPTPMNGLWGTPLYFGSQMLLAASAALAGAA